MKFNGIAIGEKNEGWCVTENAGIVEIKSGGADIWNKSDEGVFYCTEITNNFRFICRISLFEKSDLYAKAGIMARESLDSGSPHAYFAVFPDNNKRNKNNGGYEFQYREKLNGKSFAIYPKTHNKYPPEYPVNYPDTWLKLVRDGNKFISYGSKDGKIWDFYCIKQLLFREKVYIGVAATAHSNTTMTTVKVDNIIIK